MAVAQATHLNPSLYDLSYFIDSLSLDSFRAADDCLTLKELGSYPMLVESFRNNFFYYYIRKIIIVPKNIIFFTSIS